MVGPVVKIGVPGTSSYRVNWQPVAQGWGDLGRGLGDLGKSIQARRDKEQKTQQQKTLGELMAGDSSNEEIVSQATAAGVPIGTTFKFLHARESLKPKESDSPFNNFYNPTTRERKAARRGSNEAASLAASGWLTGDPSADTPTETFTDVDSPYGKGGFGQRSSTTNKISGYQAPTLKGDGAKPFETEQKLRKEYSGESDVFRKTQDSFRRVISSADGKSAAGDMALIFNFMKTLDPGSVVRESEFALAASAGSFGQQVQAGAQKVLSGERLTPKQRSDFMQTATRAYMGQADQQERRRVQYSNIAQQYGLDPSRALVDYLDMDMLKRFGEPQGQPAPTRQGNASDRFANNDWRGPPQNAPAQASLMSAPSPRSTPGAVRRDQFDSGAMPPGGRGAGDEFGAPFDASGLAAPSAPSPFEAMGRAGLMQVNPNTLDNESLAAYIAAMERQTQGGG